MNLQTIELVNYAQHEALSANFEGNLIGVIGNNGRGKSNFLGAMQFLMTGEQTGKDKGDLLRWGAETGHVSGTFTHNGISGSITRSLTGSKAKLVYNGQETSGIKNVDEVIKDIMADKELLKRGVFVAQRELDTVLFDNPAAREQEFLRMIGLGFASKTYEAITAFLGTRGQTKSYAETVEALNAQLQISIDQVQKLSEQLAEMRKKVTAGVVDTASLKAMRDDAMRQKSELTAAVNAYRSACATSATTRNMLRNAEDKLKSLRDPIESETVESLTAMIQNCEAVIANMQRYQSVVATLNDVRAKLSALKQPDAVNEIAIPFSAEEIEQLKKDVVDAAAAVTNATANNELYTKLASALKNIKTAECPVCGNTNVDLTRIAQKQSEAAAQYHAAQKRMDAVSAALTEKLQRNNETTWLNERNKQEYQLSRSQYDVSKARLESQLNELEKALAAFPVNTADPTMKDLPASVNQAKVLLNSKHTYLRAKGSLEATIAGYRQALEPQETQEQTLLATIGGSQETAAMQVSGLEARIAQMDDVLRQAQSVQTAIAAAEAGINAQNTHIASLQAQLRDFMAKQDRELRMAHKLGVLNNVKSWFHHSNGPRAVMHAVLQELTDDVNSYLEYFAAPFRVLPGVAGFGLDCQFIDGREMPEGNRVDAKILSGGERVMLAISFRLACYAMFAQRFGLLVLDEPTVYLDRHNVGRIPQVLEQVKALSKRMGIKIIISTHEEALLPYMDSVIRIV